VTRILTTMWGDDWWSSQVTVVDRRKMSRWRYLRTIYREAPDHDVVLVVGSLAARELYIDLIATGLLKLRRKRPPVIVTDATWEPGSATLAKRLGPLARVLPWASRVAIRAIDHPSNVYTVLSSEECTTFPATWGIPAERVVYTPFHVTLFDYLDAEPTPGDYVFAGGDSLRDHGLLLRAVDGLDVPVRIASGKLPAELPPNVTAGRVPHDEYMRLLLGCRLVVVPLLVRNRSAGQQTYLNAMALGKPVIVTDAPGVADHVEDGRTGFVVPPDADALRERLRWVLDPANAEAVAAVAAAGRAEARGRFGADAYVRRLLELCGDMAANSVRS
jgi:glycosyltransferase involved in cell wall biosynthesis